LDRVIGERFPRNTGKKWSDTDLFDLRGSIERGYQVPIIAIILLRTENEVRNKALELGLRLPPNVAK
jgi:hypothetical protein